MNLSSFSRVSLLIAILLVAACSSGPVVVDTKQPEVLTILPDGTMRLMGRLLPAEDVVIYPDGYGGEKAAVKVRIEPPASGILPGQYHRQTDWTDVGDRQLNRQADP